MLSWAMKVSYSVYGMHYYMHVVSNGPPLSWSYGSWIYNYLCNQYLSQLTLRVQVQLRRGVLDTRLCYKVCQWLSAGRWFSPVNPMSSTNKTDHHDIAEILLKVALNTITFHSLQINNAITSSQQRGIYKGA